MSKNNSGGGVTTNFAKCFILFMGCMILVQGAVYTGLAIWGLTMSNCNDRQTDATGQLFNFALDLVYFTDEACGKPAITLDEETNLMFTIPVDLQKTTVIHDRFQIFLITYTAVSALWVITSLLVIATICGPVTNLAVGLSFWPWIIVVMAGSVLDAVATGYFIHDIINTASVDKLFAFLGIANDSIENFDKFQDTMTSNSEYFMTPSLVMTLISSRVVIIWLLNILGSSFCLSLSTVLKQGNNRDAATSSAISPMSTEANTNNDPNNESNSPSNNVIVSRQQSLAQQEQQQQQWQQQAYVAQEEPMEQFATPRQSVPVRILPPPPSTYQQQPQPQQPFDGNIRQRRHPDNAMQASDARPKLTINEATTYRNTDTHPDRIDYPTQAASPINATQTTSPPPQISVVSPLNNRYSNNDNMFPYQQSSLGQPGRISQELRGQLPWSYTGSAAPMPPRKPQVQIYPDIPEPDYGDN